jgi:hypothetical protein
MAKKHTNGHDASVDSPAQVVYSLEPNRWALIPSRVLTMELEDPTGKMIEVEKKYLMKTDDAGNPVMMGKKPVYRFMKRIPAPIFDSSVVRDADSLAMEILAFADRIGHYDASTHLSNDLIKKDGQETAVKPRPDTKVSVSSNGEPIDPIQYVARLIVEGHRLSVQKQMQKEVRASAEDTLREELGIERPAGSVRTSKADEPAGPSDADILFGDDDSATA